MRTLLPSAASTTVLTTGIGSLPYRDVETAIDHAFRNSIPFLPQLPQRSHQEGMIAQSLEGLPGLKVGPLGQTGLDLNQWRDSTANLKKRLHAALESGQLDEFLPTPASWSCWQPFLNLLKMRGADLAKIQITGPMTCIQALKIEGDLAMPIELADQISQLLLVRTLSMIRAMLDNQINPIVFLDEPGFNSASEFSEYLKSSIVKLKAAGAIVGLHSCAPLDFADLLSWGIDIIAFDTSQSLPAPELFLKFADQGGRIAWGIIPTHDAPTKSIAPAQELIDNLRSRLLSQSEGSGTREQNAGLPAKIQNLLQTSIYTPACGLGLKTLSEAELIFKRLDEINDCVSAS